MTVHVSVSAYIRIAAKDARLGFTFVKLGIHPGLQPVPVWCHFLCPQILCYSHYASLCHIFYKFIFWMCSTNPPPDIFSFDIPGMGASLLLPRLVAQQKATEYLLTGMSASGEEAAKDGLVLKAVDKVGWMREGRTRNGWAVCCAGHVVMWLCSAMFVAALTVPHGIFIVSYCWLIWTSTGTESNTFCSKCRHWFSTSSILCQFPGHLHMCFSLKSWTKLLP